MPGLELIKAISGYATSSGSRSTALKPLSWLAGILAALLAAALKYNVPAWMLIWLGILISVAVIYFGIAYTYFMVKNPDALRSERFHLQKIAIEKSLRGDDVTGIIEADLIEEEEPSKLQKQTGDVAVVIAEKQGDQ